MSPSSDAMLRKLRSDSPNERLEAARYFAEYASVSEERALREASAKESVRWIKSALRRAIARISSDPDEDDKPPTINYGDLPEGFAAQVFAEALETTTSQLLHEIEPILGTLRLSAEAEVEGFESSETRRAIERLDDFLSALSRLRQAASAPKIQEFSLDDLIVRCVQETARPSGVQILKTGSVPCIVEGDGALIGLCISNGLRNAVEATMATGTDTTQLPVTVAWGTTDLDYWVSIVDLGIGFKGNLQRAFEIGTTSKDGHLGMGLAIAQQSMTSMQGRVLLVPNERGVRFEMRWPRK